MGQPGSFDDYPEIMTSDEVAKMLLITKVDSIHRLAREGRIPAHREPGARRWRFHRDELIAWLRSETKVRPER